MFFSTQLSGQVFDSSEYVQEIKGFYKDVFNDTTRYSLLDFNRDSLKVKVNDDLKSYSWYDPYETIRNKIDTTDSKFMIRTEFGRLHFDTLSIIDEFLDYYSNPLKVWLQRPDFNDIANPISKEDINEILDIYTILDDSLNPKIIFENVQFLSKDKIHKYYNYNNGWKDLLKEYGNYIGLTIPAFNKTYEYALFEWTLHCGNMCEYGYFGLYHKTNDKWVPVFVWQLWMS